MHRFSQARCTPLQKPFPLSRPLHSFVGLSDDRFLQTAREIEVSTAEFEWLATGTRPPPPPPPAHPGRLRRPHWRPERAAADGVHGLRGRRRGGVPADGCQGTARQDQQRRPRRRAALPKHAVLAADLVCARGRRLGCLPPPGRPGAGQGSGHPPG